jgi:hypothetical protein
MAADRVTGAMADLLLNSSFTPRHLACGRWAIIGAPGDGLGVRRVEMGEKLSKGEQQFLQSIISHYIDRAQNIEILGQVAMVLPVQRLQAKKIGGCAN